MKQIVMTRSGGVEVFKIEDIADPSPGREELIVRVKASGINFADILARQGLYPDAPKFPCVVGYEISGVVERVGEGVKEWQAGEEVIALTRFGGYADVVKVHPLQVFRKPARLSFEEAAAIPVNYLTAYQLLVVMGGLKKDETILIHNAGGGVGLAALDIARHIGALTYGTASPHKHDFLRQRGLQYPIDYRNRDWLSEVKRLTDGRGVDLIIDPLGGQSWKKSYKALLKTGRLGMFGISTAMESNLQGKLRLLKTLVQMPFFHPVVLMNANKGVFGVNLGQLWSEGKKIRQWALTILEGVEEGWVRPHVDKTYPFEAVGEAHTYIEERKNIGKVVLVLEP